ncbi:MAG: hypothetical protein RL481_1122 [Pseudomonadota bacterium]
MKPDFENGWQTIASLELEKLESTRGRIMEQHASAHKWLMASLLALNGAGLLAVKDVASRFEMIPYVAALFFYLGCAAAMYVAVLGQRASQVGLEFLSRAITFWTVVKVSGEFNAEAQQEMMGDQNDLAVASKLAPKVARFSFGFFSAGLICLVIASATKTEVKSVNAPTKQHSVNTKNDR